LGRSARSTASSPPGSDAPETMRGASIPAGAALAVRAVEAVWAGRGEKSSV